MGYLHIQSVGRELLIHCRNIVAVEQGAEYSLIYTTNSLQPIRLTNAEYDAFKDSVQAYKKEFYHVRVNDLCLWVNATYIGKLQAENGKFKITFVNKDGIKVNAMHIEENYYLYFKHKILEKEMNNRAKMERKDALKEEKERLKMENKEV